MKTFIRKLARERKGGTAIEYGLIAALIVITMIAAFTEVAHTTVGMWSNVNTRMQNARDGN
jgi:pilus assembly protein Flp/PilA